jgi:hypothetical protein
MFNLARTRLATPALRAVVRSPDFPETLQAVDKKPARRVTDIANLPGLSGAQCCRPAEAESLHPRVLVGEPFEECMFPEHS